MGSNPYQQLIHGSSLSEPRLNSSRPLTPGQRHQVLLTEVKDGLQWSPRHMKLRKLKTGGRNQQGVIVTRHHGGGNKQQARCVRPLWPSHRGLILGTQWDPCRNAPVSLILDLDRLHRVGSKGSGSGLLSYVITGNQMKVGSVLCGPQPDSNALTTPSLEISRNTRCRRSWIPTGSMIYDRSLDPRDPIKSSRFKSAGTYGRIVGHGFSQGDQEGRSGRGDDGKESRSRIRSPSGEERRIPSSAYATVGSVSCEDFKLQSFGKAGKIRARGVRPTVRGCAMNPIDHPHGGRTKGGRHEVTPWASLAKNQRTRDPQASSPWVVKSARQARHERKTS